MSLSNQPDTTFGKQFWRQTVHKRHPLERLYRACGQPCECQPLCDDEQMIQRSLAIAHTPVLIAFIHFIEQLRGADDQQDMAHHGNNECSQPEEVKPAPSMPCRRLCLLKRSSMSVGTAI